MIKEKVGVGERYVEDASTLVISCLSACLPACLPASTRYFLYFWDIGAGESWVTKIREPGREATTTATATGVLGVEEGEGRKRVVQRMRRGRTKTHIEHRAGSIPFALFLGALTTSVAQWAIAQRDKKPELKDVGERG